MASIMGVSPSGNCPVEAVQVPPLIDLTAGDDWRLMLMEERAETLRTRLLRDEPI